MMSSATVPQTNNPALNSCNPNATELQTQLSTEGQSLQTSDSVSFRCFQ